jgi:hypothetical protein
MPIFVDGQQVKIPVERLIAEGKYIIEQEGIPTSKIFDLKAFAASVAVAKYDQAHREWIDAHQGVEPE